MGNRDSRRANSWDCRSPVLESGDVGMALDAAADVPFSFPVANYKPTAHPDRCLTPSALLYDARLLPSTILAEPPAALWKHGPPAARLRLRHLANLGTWSTLYAHFHAWIVKIENWAYQMLTG